MRDYGLDILFRENRLEQNDLKLRNKAYIFWKESWQDVHRELGLDHPLNGDIFTRYDAITVISANRGRTIVATAMHSFLNLNDLATREIKYMTTFDPLFIQTLESRGIERVMTYEYITVNPIFRGLGGGVSLGRVIVQLGVNLFKEMNFQALLCAARYDNSAVKLAKGVGFEPIVDQSDFRGFKCSQMVLEQGKQIEYRDPKANQAASDLWEKRQLHPSTGPIQIPKVA